MKLAKSIVERYNKLPNKKPLVENELPVVPAVTQEPAQPPISPVQEAKKWLKENKWSESNELQSQAADKMKILAEADDEDANKMMGYVDEMCSKYESEAPVEQPIAGIVNPALESEEEDSEDEEDEKNEDDSEDEDDKEDEKNEDDSDSEDDEDEDEKNEDDSEEDEEEEEKNEDSDSEDDEEDKDDLEEDDDDSEDDSEEEKQDQDDEEQADKFKKQ